MQPSAKMSRWAVNSSSWQERQKHWLPWQEWTCPFQVIYSDNSGCHPCPERGRDDYDCHLTAPPQQPGVSMVTVLGMARKFQQEIPFWKCFVFIRVCLFPSKDALQNGAEPGARLWYPLQKGDLGHLSESDWAPQEQVREPEPPQAWQPERVYAGFCQLDTNLHTPGRGTLNWENASIGLAYRHGKSVGYCPG